MGGKDDRILRPDRDLTVVVLSHTAQCRHTLSLTSGCDDDRLFIRIILQKLCIDQCVFRNIQISQRGRSLNDIDHAAALYDYFSAKLICGIDDLLHTVHV